MARPVDLAWAAGIFDGEGSCSIIVKWKGGNYCYSALRAAVNMTHRLTIERLRELFGGLVYVDRTPIRRLPQYRWELSTLQAPPFLEAIRPYAVTKVPQIELALGFIANRYGNTGRPRGRGARLTEGQRALAQGYSLAMKELNRNGCV